MTDATDTTTDGDRSDGDRPEGGRSSTRSFDKAVMVGAGVALAAVVVAAQRDIATQDRLRGPRWLWHVIATTPPGVVLYGLLGPRGHPFGDLPAPTVHKQVPPS